MGERLRHSLLAETPKFIAFPARQALVSLFSPILFVTFRVKGHHRSRSGSNLMGKRWGQAMVAETPKLIAFRPRQA